MVSEPLAPATAGVLDVDPELGAGIDPGDWEAARTACRGKLLRVGRGPWDLPADVGDRDDVAGLLIVVGALCRELALGDRFMVELLGARDVLQLPVRAGRPRLGESIRLTAVRETMLLVVGETFLRAAIRWPCLLATLLRRLEVQRQRLAVQGAIAHLPRAEDRLLLMLWHLADRWGYSHDEGTVLQLSLTHDVLGQLIGASRSTVTVAASVLQADDLLRRLDDGSWVLPVAAESTIARIARSATPARALGETITLRQSALHARSDARALRAQAGQMRIRLDGSSTRTRAD